MAKRVAIFGARGIGRHHAAWWHLEGAAVCAFAGASAASLTQTRAVLGESFGFAGKGYTDVAALLAAEQPDIVDVCTPPPCHAAQVWAALEAGCDVLCEKPFVYDPAADHEALLSQAESLFTLARERGRHLSVCTQYSAGARIFQHLFASRRGDEPVTACHGQLEAPAKERGPDPARIWVDLSPHLLSVILEVAPGAVVQWDTLRTHFAGYEACAAFDVRADDGRIVSCELETRNRTEPPSNIRRFGLNGYEMDVAGVRGNDGAFGARIVTTDNTVDTPDMMRLLIRDFLGGRPTVSPAAALRNLEIMLEILARSSSPQTR